jgi:hypothetical protein
MVSKLYAESKIPPVTGSNPVRAGNFGDKDEK